MYDTILLAKPIRAHASGELSILMKSLQVREIYETAIEAEESYQLTDSDTKTLCLRYLL